MWRCRKSRRAPSWLDWPPGAHAGTGRAAGAGRQRAGDRGQQFPAVAGPCGLKQGERAHLLRTDTPAVAPTTEQKIRGHADRTADWIFIVTGYDLAVLRQLGDEALAPAALAALGAAPGAVAGWYSLSLSMTRGETAQMR